MGSYTLNILGPRGNIIEGYRLEADDDAEALRESASVVDDRPMELWSGTRLVAHTNPKDAPLLPLKPLHHNGHHQ
jgi:hypothetical protein